MLGFLKGRTVVEGGIRVARLAGQCAKLLTERGQAVSVSLARETWKLYAELNRREQVAFFLALLNEFSPDPQQILAAAERYAAEPSGETLEALAQAVESPRQELVRRLNGAPGGMAAVLRLREHLQAAMREQPRLGLVDADLRHLLSSWFNPGFLQVVRVDWRTPAYLLERIIAHEAVHEIRGWDDLRRRLERDRRCFAFFHPALPDEPLIFVEVALLEEMPDTIASLLDAPLAPSDPERATVAVLYSINNCQPGLRGVSLGNSLVKQVAELLSAELSRLRRICTLSPIPSFSAWLVDHLRKQVGDRPQPLGEALHVVARDLGRDLSRLAPDPAQARQRLESLKGPLMALCATYLLSPVPEGESMQDPVARFHLNNGARLARVNWAADLSKRGLQQSMGMMVNYLYDPREIEANHDRFLQGRIMASRQVTSLALER
ncbi:MAG TPA: malonyl-CoA decarboxylase family protein [Candidatus Methylomirabilis sp.]|nr:malonyl-CoA decarboxylase family protein [Candidatus Methylomirabilis sp.]